MSAISDSIDQIIVASVKKYDQTFAFIENSFEEILSFGELVDRLSIINFKLYKLKDEVMAETASDSFKSWAANEDVKLVMERARLKKAIDSKILYIIHRVINGDSTGGINSEVKKYGEIKQ